MVSLRERLRQARFDSGLSQAQLAVRAAELSGHAPATLRASIAAYERPDGHEPRWETVSAVLAGLGLEIALVPAAKQGDSEKRQGP